MNSAFEFSKKAIEVGWKYVATTRQSRKSADLFRHVETYCMFLGYPRSGHSIIGALLDAHPSAIIAHELADLKYIRAGFDRLRLFNLLLQNSQTRAHSKRKSGVYFYYICWFHITLILVLIHLLKVSLPFVLFLLVL